MARKTHKCVGHAHNNIRYTLNNTCKNKEIRYIYICNNKRGAVSGDDDGALREKRCLCGDKKVLRLRLEPDTTRQCWALSNSNEQTQASSSNSYVHQKINTKLRLAKSDERLKNKHHPPAKHTVALMKGDCLSRHSRWGFYVENVKAL